MNLTLCAMRGLATDLDARERRRKRPDIGCFEVQADLGLRLLVK